MRHWHIATVSLHGDKALAQRYIGTAKRALRRLQYRIEAGLANADAVSIRLAPNIRALLHVAGDVNVLRIYATPTQEKAAAICKTQGLFLGRSSTTYARGYFKTLIENPVSPQCKYRIDIAPQDAEYDEDGNFVAPGKEVEMYCCEFRPDLADYYQEGDPISIIQLGPEEFYIAPSGSYAMQTIDGNDDVILESSGSTATEWFDKDEADEYAEYVPAKFDAMADAFRKCDWYKRVRVDEIDYWNNKTTISFIDKDGVVTGERSGVRVEYMGVNQWVFTAGTMAILQKFQTRSYQIFKLINDYREQNGLQRLQWSLDLHAVALKYAQVMLENQEYAHNTSDPVWGQFVDRMQYAGLTHNAVENLSLSQSDPSSMSTTKYSMYGFNSFVEEREKKHCRHNYDSPGQIVQGWIDSPEHNEAMLDPDIEFGTVGMHSMIYDGGEWIANVYVFNASKDKPTWTLPTHFEDESWYIEHGYEIVGFAGRPRPNGFKTKVINHEGLEYTPANVEPNNNNSWVLMGICEAAAFDRCAAVGNYGGAYEFPRNTYNEVFYDDVDQCWVFWRGNHKDSITTGERNLGNMSGMVSRLDVFGGYQIAVYGNDNNNPGNARWHWAYNNGLLWNGADLSGNGVWTVTMWEFPVDHEEPLAEVGTTPYENMGENHFDYSDQKTRDYRALDVLDGASQIDSVTLTMNGSADYTETETTPGNWDRDFFYDQTAVGSTSPTGQLVVEDMDFNDGGVSAADTITTRDAFYEPKGALTILCREVLSGVYSDPDHPVDYNFHFELYQGSGLLWSWDSVNFQKNRNVFEYSLSGSDYFAPQPMFWHPLIVLPGDNALIDETEEFYMIPHEAGFGMMSDDDPLALPFNIGYKDSIWGVHRHVNPLPHTENGVWEAVYLEYSPGVGYSVEMHWALKRRDSFSTIVQRRLFASNNVLHNHEI